MMNLFVVGPILAVSVDALNLDRRHKRFSRVFFCYRGVVSSFVAICWLS